VIALLDQDGTGSLTVASSPHSSGRGTGVNFS
jgi:hypothetical protein